ncbi:MAG: hypothetical protein ACF8Q5_08410 [Phycisphaerales bacterium JB040]
MRYPTLLTTILIACLGACSTPRPARDTVPPAFEASLTVLHDRGEPVPDDAGPLAPARFVVEADGWLRAGRGTGVSRATLPPRVRRLPTDDRDRLWELVRQSGLLDPNDPVRIASGNGPLPDRARPLLVITVRGDEGMHAGAVALRSSLAEPYRPMLELLHERAWMSP